MRLSHIAQRTYSESFLHDIDIGFLTQEKYFGFAGEPANLSSRFNSIQTWQPDMNARMTRTFFLARDPTVKQKRVQQLLQIVKEGFQRAGSPIDDMALDFALSMAEYPRFRELTEKQQQVAMAAVAAGFLYGAKEYESVPEDQWNKLLSKLREELPYSLRPAFRTGLKEVVKSLPKRPSTGRDAVLTSKQKKEACKLISKYHLNGDSKRAAYEKVARNMNCSPRTVQRAWQERTLK
jgi:hypothetical protein